SAAQPRRHRIRGELGGVLPALGGRKLHQWHHGESRWRQLAVPELPAGPQDPARPTQQPGLRRLPSRYLPPDPAIQRPATEILSPCPSSSRTSTSAARISRKTAATCTSCSPTCGTRSS